MTQTAFDRCIIEMDKLQTGITELEDGVADLGRGVDDLGQAVDGLKRATIASGVGIGFALFGILLLALAFN